jgi:diguanylate cyclase (GGDEF)-like protein/PAS domain S-box-containing protein
LTIDRIGSRPDTPKPPAAKVGDDHSGSDAPSLEALPLPLVILASDGTIEHANGAAKAALGTPLRELEGHPFRELIGRCWRPVFQAALSNVNGSERDDASASVTVLDLPLQTESGEVRFGISIASHSTGDEGRIHLLLHPSSPNPGNGGSTPHEAALDASEDAILCTDLDGRILYCNGRFLEMWKIPRSALSDGLESVLSIANEQLEDPEAFMEMTDREAGEPDRESRDLLQFRDRKIVERCSRPLPIGDHLVGHVISFRDVTRQQRARETIRSSERRYRLLFERNVAGVFRASRDGAILEVNDAFARLVGYEAPLEVQGKSITDFYASLPERRRFGEDLERNRAIANREVQFTRKDGSTIWVLENSILVEDPELMEPVIEGTIVDITARKRLETELERMAYHDPLTDLANRRLLEERARMSLAFADRHGIQAGLVYLDLSRFKRINDTLGHEAGDDVLVEVANRIRSCLRGSDTASRLGGDEFACLLAEVGGERGALAVAQRIANSLSEPFELADRTLHVDAQIGVAMYPEHAADFESLLAAADRAMYRTKIDGNPAIEVYSATLDESVPDVIAEEEELREALEKAQLRLHYQPIFKLADGKLVGAEALVRWDHPSRGLLEASEFIRTAERGGVIRQLDRWVVEEAHAQAVRWEKRELPEWISVNQSIQTLRDPEATRFVQQLLDQGPVPPGRLVLVLEVNEGFAVNSPEAVTARLDKLREMGIRIALDNFGTGQATLANIKHFPADIIKLDGFFVRDLGTNYDSRNLAQAIIQMGQALGVAIIAEKVETEAQCEWLKSAGCDYVQGYYTGRPVPADEFMESVRERTAIPRNASP